MRIGLLPCNLRLRAGAKEVEEEQTVVLEVTVALAASMEALEEEVVEMEAQEGH
jgi:hypothetical protein